MRQWQIYTLASLFLVYINKMIFKVTEKQSEYVYYILGVIAHLFKEYYYCMTFSSSLIYGGSSQEED